MSTESSSTIIVVNNPVVAALHPTYKSDWMEPILEEPEHDVDAFIVSLFEDLPTAEPHDYAEVDLEEHDCQCDECLGTYYDDRDDYQDDYGGGLDWNESGYFD